jgi:hypothetical protein
VIRVSVSRANHTAGARWVRDRRHRAAAALPDESREIDMARLGVRRAFTSCQYREGDPQSEHQPKRPCPCWWSLPSVSSAIISIARPPCPAVLPGVDGIALLVTLNGSWRSWPVTRLVLDLSRRDAMRDGRRVSRKREHNFGPSALR